MAFIFDVQSAQADCWPQALLPRLQSLGSVLAQGLPAHEQFNMLSLSIVIPTLREAANIGPLLAVLQAQDYPGPLEIIVVDGGSDDGTPAIAQQFEGVRLLRHEPAGTSAQRNLGAGAATGELLVFMDADNQPAPTFLAGIAKSYTRRPFEVACPWFVADSRHPAIRCIYFVFNILFWLSQWRFHTGSGVCIIVRRGTFWRGGGFAEWLHLGEDIHLIRRVAAASLLLGVIAIYSFPCALPLGAFKNLASGTWCASMPASRLCC